VLRVGQFGAVLGLLVCVVCESLWLVWDSDFVLCVGQFGVGLGE